MVAAVLIVVSVFMCVNVYVLHRHLYLCMEACLCLCVCSYSCAALDCIVFYCGAVCYIVNAIVIGVVTVSVLVSAIGVVL